jgi:phosphatidylserine/phosphatidylglycerophosphate/cardiolipin synthase-like enzyme
MSRTHLTHALALAIGISGTLAAQTVKEISGTMAPYYSPAIPGESTPTPAICHQIGGAKKQILVQCYSFTSPHITQALIDAKKRGVDVQLIADKSDRTGRGELIDEVAKAGIPVTIDAKHAIAHNKVMVIDDTVVITGSFNFTVAAENSNAENCLIIKSRDLAAHYKKNWIYHDRHSERYPSGQ